MPEPGPDIPSPPRVAAVIVNWNGGALTSACLEHLPGLGFADLVLVDNGSTDGSAEAAEAILAGRAAEILRNPDNRGFARAANQGMVRALERGADFVFLLNNDARMEPRTLPALLEAAARRPRAGLLAGKILDGGGTRIWCAGVDLGFHHNLQRMRGFGRPDDGSFEREEEVDALTGCGLLVRRELIEAIGTFDESLFVYVEDVDYALRARDAGFACLYVPGARMTHEASSASGGGYNAWRKYMVAYDLVLVLKKRRDLRLWTAFVLIELLGWPLLMLAAILRGRRRAAVAKLRGMVHALLGREARPPRTRDT
ncbi:MAG: glycosyltransferase family 2 protein [Planctomycetes bacterium]|nr:glycosyltransferase family 2 protein [Planctomycetota bacterium]